MEREKPAIEVKTINVAVPRDIANRLKVVAAHREMSMIDALEKYLRPIIDREYRKCVEAANTDLGEAGA
jgi:hypothetical protein